MLQVSNLLRAITIGILLSDENYNHSSGKSLPGICTL